MQNIIFDPNKRRNAKLRAENRNVPDSFFLHSDMATILADRLSVTNREFKNTALLFQNNFSEELETILKSEADNIHGPFTQIPFPTVYQNKQTDEKFTTSENLALPANQFDLIISIFDLHWMNDLPGAFAQINNSLQPDGLFAAVLPSQGTLEALHECLVEAEMHFKSGASMRVDPFPQVRQLGDLLRRANFKLPVADVEQRTINYSSITKLISDFRNVGATHMGPSTKKISKKIWELTIKLYKQRYANSDAKLPVEISCTFLSGWKEHSSQQKPLKPGTAANKLSDFL